MLEKRVALALGATDFSASKEGELAFGSDGAMILPNSNVPEYTQQAYLLKEFENVMEMNQIEQTPEVEMDSYIPNRTNIEHDGMDR